MEVREREVTMDENKNVPSFATSSVRKRPRSRVEWEVLRKWEMEQGYPTGNIGNRVWVDAGDQSQGIFELDAEGNELAWFPTPGIENRE